MSDRDFARCPARPETLSSSASASAAGLWPARFPVSRPGDSQEREADRMAEQVLRGPGLAPVSAVSHPAAALPGSGSGRPLDPTARAFMEPRFGRDLSHVRVHTDPPAAEAARNLGAHAFSLGNHIVFGRSQYAPDGTAGRRLLAHELAHVVQPGDTPAGVKIFRQDIPGWNFQPVDYLRLKLAGEKLTIASDSSFFPVRLQENLLNTLAYLLGQVSPLPGTEGVNALDLFHAHLVIKHDTATRKLAAAAEDKGWQFSTDLAKKRVRVLGRTDVDKGNPLTQKNLPAWRRVVTQALPSLGQLLDEASQVPGAAVLYHTFEFLLKDRKGREVGRDDRRRNYLTPVNTNAPADYSPPPNGYEEEYTHVVSFSFLVDDKGAVHVRTFSAGSSGFTTLDLSTITGTLFPGDPFQLDPLPPNVA